MRKSFFIIILYCLPFTLAAQQALSQSKPLDLFNNGLNLLAHREFGAASMAFSGFLSASGADDPRRPDAAYYGAYCAVTLYHADGEKKIEQFIDDFPDHPRVATAYFDLASFFYQQKNYVKAVSYFSKTDFPSLSSEQQNTGRFRWGYSLFNQRNLAEALDQFSFIKAQGGQYGPAASYYAGFIAYNNNDYANALIDLKRAELNPSYSSIVPFLISQILYNQEKYDELLSYISTLESRDDLSQKEDIALLGGEAFFRKGDYINALAGFETYLDGQQNPDKGVLYRTAFSAMKAGNDQRAIDLFKNVAISSDSVGAYSSYYLGSLYLKSNQKPLAITAFDVARKFNSNSSLEEESSFQFSKLAYDLGRSDQAILELEKFQVAFPASPRIGEVKEILSHAYVDANNYNKAIIYIESLPERGPSVDRAYQKATYLKGTELFNMERYAEAISFFEKSLQYPIDRGITAESHFWCAEAYSIDRKYELAIDHYAVLISPVSLTDAQLKSQARYGLGYVYFNLKQYDRALFNFKEFVNKTTGENSFLGDALLRLADCHYVSKSYADALSTYRQVMKSNSPDKDYAHLQAGIILGIQRKYQEAAIELDQVARNYPQSNHKEEALFQMAQLEFEQGKYAAAISGYSKVIENNKASRFVPYAHMRRAASYYNLKEYDKTAADYILLVEQYTTHPVVGDVLVPLQEALSLSGRSAEFDKYLAGFKSANPDAKGIESVDFETAKNLYFNQEYIKAIQRLGIYITAYPESPRVSEAKFYQSESYYRQRDYPQALKGYNEISTDDAFSLINKVVSRIAELEYKEGHYDQAISGFQRLAFISTNKKEQYTAWSGLMESHYLLAQYDSADKYAKIILEKGNINAGATNKASLFLGKTAMARGDYETAKDEFLHTLNTARDEYGAEAKYLMGEIFYLNKEHKQCYETLLSLNNDFAAYTEWVGESYLLLTDNFIAMGEVFQARGTLKSLIDNFPVQSIKDRAAEKLRVLDEAEQRQKENVEKDSANNK